MPLEVRVIQHHPQPGEASPVAGPGSSQHPAFPPTSSATREASRRVRAVGYPLPDFRGPKPEARHLSCVPPLRPTDCPGPGLPLWDGWTLAQEENGACVRGLHRIPVPSRLLQGLGGSLGDLTPAQEQLLDRVAFRPPSFSRPSWNMDRP